jgi:hypothetical protein
MSNNNEVLFRSSAVMLRRKKPISWSFCKDRRFKERKKSMDAGYVMLPSALSPRATIMGFGTRWTPRNERGQDSPPPGSYSIPSTLTSKGPKIVKDSSLPPLTSTKFSTPGPGSYETLSPLGKEAPKYSFHGIETRISVNESPAPGCYSPKNTVTEFAGFREISFGVGKRKVFWNSGANVPGPGTYNILSNFDKKRLKSNK